MSEANVTSEETKGLGQVYFEDAEEFKATGMANAEAVRQVAEKYGKPVNSVRGAIYQYRTRLQGGRTSGRSRQRAASAEDCVSQARSSLEQALALVDTEVETARIAAERAQADYEQAQASVKSRKADIERKLKALA